jgi:translation initiation factor IF-3
MYDLQKFRNEKKKEKEKKKKVKTATKRELRLSRKVSGSREANKINRISPGG